MAAPVTIKGGKVSVKLAVNPSADPIVYSTPCGFTSRSITFTKALQDVAIPDCLSPDSAVWLGQDAVSLSMQISGEGVLDEDAVSRWVEAWQSVDSIPVQVEIEFPSKTLVWSGSVQVETLQVDAPNGQRVTINVSMQSDGQMVLVETP